MQVDTRLTRKGRRFPFNLPFCLLSLFFLSFTSLPKPHHHSRLSLLCRSSHSYNTTKSVSDDGKIMPSHREKNPVVDEMTTSRERGRKGELDQVKTWTKWDTRVKSPLFDELIECCDRINQSIFVIRNSHSSLSLTAAGYMCHLSKGILL